jgi:hypothetical protein
MMRLQPRYTVAINFRNQDKLLLDALATIARDEGNNITSVFRAAIAEYLKERAQSKEGKRLDEFLNESEISSMTCDRILSPAELRNWSDRNLLDAAKLVRSRKQELDSALRSRGYFFKW